MTVITVYRFVDGQGNDATDWQTQNYREADDYARQHGYSVMGDDYEYSDSSLVERSNYAGVGIPGDDDQYSAIEVEQMDCHGEGTREMLRCRECDEDLGAYHKADCPVATYEYRVGEWVQDARWGTEDEDGGYQFGRVYTVGFGGHYSDGSASREPMEVLLYPGAALVDGWPHVWTVEDPSHVRPFEPTPEQVAEYEARVDDHCRNCGALLTAHDAIGTDNICLECRALANAGMELRKEAH